MIIKKLKMENFKSHGNTVVDFDPGVSIIIGENGAGKSSILEAVSFALFKSHSGKNMDVLVKNEAKSLMVELDFVAHGREYQVRRIRGKSGLEPRLSFKQGERRITLATRDRQVTEEIQHILEMDSDLFLNAIYVKQGEISNLIEKTPSEKKKMIGKLLGIENLENAWKNMQPLIGGYEIKKANIKVMIEGLGVLEEDYATKNKDMEEILEDIQKYEIQIQNEQDKLNEVQTILKGLELKKEKFDVLNSDLSTTSEILNRIIKDKDSLEKELSIIREKEEKIKSVEPTLEKMKPLSHIREFLRELEALKADEERIKKSLENIFNVRTQLEYNKESYTQFLKLQDEIKTLELERTKFEGSEALQNRLLEESEEISQKIEESKKIISETLDSYNKILESEFETIEEFEIEFNSVKPRLEKEKENLLEVTEKLNTKIKSLEIQNQGLKKPIKELEQVQDQCPICKSPISENKRNELISGYQTDIDENKTNILDFKSQLQDILNEKDSLNLKLTKIQGINTQLLQEKLKTLEDSDKTLNRLSNQLEELKDKVSSLKTIDNTLKNKKKFLEKLEESYKKYLEAKGSLESLGDYEVLDSSLKKQQDEISKFEGEIKAIQEETGILIEGLDEQLGALEKMKESYHRMVGEVSQKTELLTKLQNKKAELNIFTQEIKVKTEELKKLAYDPDLHKEKKDLQVTYNSAFNLFESGKSELVGKKTALNANLKQMEQSLDSYNENKKQLNNVSDFIKLLKFIRDLFGKDGLQRELRNRSKPLIEQKTRDFFEKFNFDYSDIKIDEDYDISVYGPNGESSLDMISGGEKIAVALALRLGITQALSGGNLELIMLDEPTIHLDAYRRQELIDLFKRMSIIPQMIIVTHDPELEEAADNVLRIKKEEGNSFLVKS
ncbi:MAG: hypothetical protein BME94_02875 [Methanobacteriales archaeon Met13]